MYPKTYLLIEQCVTEGIRSGIYQHNKHRDQPIDIPAEMQANLVHAVMLEFSEWFTFTDLELGIPPAQWRSSTKHILSSATKLQGLTMENLNTLLEAAETLKVQLQKYTDNPTKAESLRMRKTIAVIQNSTIAAKRDLLAADAA